jgi:iron-sulfur cluster repair protein YtfE (RIC family)
MNNDSLSQRSDTMLGTIDPALSIDALLRLHPVAGRVLNAFGIDTCCGGSLTLTQAAAEASVPCDDVSQAISEAIACARDAKARR